MHSLPLAESLNSSAHLAMLAFSQHLKEGDILRSDFPTFEVVDTREGHICAVTPVLLKLLDRPSYVPLQHPLVFECSDLRSSEKLYTKFWLLETRRTSSPARYATL